MSKLRFVVSAAAAALALSGAGRAAAQLDVNPQMPNVLLLVDNSGSMEYLSSSATLPTCNPNSPTTSQKSRWIELQEVLTGTISDYRCQRVERRSPEFVAEYTIGGIRPYDHSYQVPYHRPISGSCTPAPGTAPSDPFSFPDSATRFRVVGGNTVCNTWTQANDGLLDIYLNQVRFGLMTFDSLPDDGTGLNGTSADPVSGMQGLWSYFRGAGARGAPADCAVDRPFEVGARNAAAPPWEGRLVSFGPPSMTKAEVDTKNQQIQRVLLTSRPYGATPIAGMLEDAHTFFTEDNTTVGYQGPADDAYKACRKRVIVLLTDGEPNTDMRPDCARATTGPDKGQCPYATPEVTADLLAKLNPAIKTFVVGFAVSNVTLGDSSTIDCQKMTSEQLNGVNGTCAQNPDNGPLQACCTLNRIAVASGTERAHFAADKEALRQALNAIMADVLTETSSRTLPVFAVASTTQSDLASGFRFYSSFVPQQLDLWSGVLERKRITCEANDEGELEVQIQDVDPEAGDDFVANVNSGKGPARTFVSVLPELDNTQRHSGRTIRPNIGLANDGLGNYGGTQYQEPAATFVTPSKTPATALKLPATLPVHCAGLSTADECSERLLKWLVGLPNGTSNSRCRMLDTLECNLVGDIYHSTPRVVGPPSELLRDETYENFAVTRAKRPLMLYTSTNDGFFHGFKVASNETATVDTNRVDKKENNELWAFIPPAVLPRITDQYPSSHALLLDGVPVAKDVAAVPSGNSFRFERTLASARLANAAAAGASTWRTAVVQSFGSTLGGYFALDVTDPAITQTTGPRFLWQLTTDEAGTALFGAGGATPLITTVFIEEPAGEGFERKEVAVAVLPGGRAGTASVAATCDRATKAAGTTDLSPSTFPARTKVRCYSNPTGRALTVVRLDSGEILAQFRRAKSEAPSINQARIIEVPLDSPITGEPVAFPGATGAIADKVFVGDEDGVLWRVDLSAPKPADWKMALFLDAYSKEPASVIGEPIVTPPVLSTDFAGNVTVAFSTGDQDVFSASGTHYVFSATSDLDSPSTAAKVNWYNKFTDGERVTGPITLFNGVLYYSTFKPAPPSAVCQPDSSRVWGVDYVLPKDAQNLADGGKAAFPATLTTDQFIDSSDDLFGSDATIFGVSVAQLPSCTETETTFDTFYGAGSHTTISNVVPSKFQLVMQVGRSQGNEGNQKTQVVSFDLPTPSASPRIDSWAAIVE